MEFNELVSIRRSIRKFKEGATIDKNDIVEMVKTSQNSPSWKNSQTPRYYAVLSDEMLAKVKNDCLPEFNRNSSANAPALIVTTFVKTRAGFNRDGVADNELGDEWGAYDLGLANQLLILKAKEMGYDTLIMGIRDGEKLREYLEIPDTEEVVAVIAVGYRDINPEMPKRKDTNDILKIF